MIFDNDVKKILLDGYKNNEKFTIIGCNGYSQNFKVTGVVATDDKNEPAIFDKVLYLKLGETEKDENSTEKVELIAPYCTNLDSKNNEANSCRLFIYQILDSKGDYVYMNADARKIQQNGKKLNLEKTEENRRKNKLVDNMDPVSFKMQELIGNAVMMCDVTPIGFNELRKNVRSGVVVSVDSISNNGSIKVTLVDTFLPKDEVINSNTVLYHIKDDKTSDRVASNITKFSRQLWESRVRKIQECQNNNDLEK